jgi:hypothetical protein
MALEEVLDQALEVVVEQVRWGKTGIGEGETTVPESVKSEKLAKY